jgi:hypothetical protein
MPHDGGWLAAKLVIAFGGSFLRYFLVIMSINVLWSVRLDGGVRCAHHHHPANAGI